MSADNLERNGGVLVTIATAKTLPCADTCAFAKKCAQKYYDGTCVEVIENSVSQMVNGQPGEKLVTEERITFKTTEPEGKVDIMNGYVFISRPTPGQPFNSQS